MFIRKSKNMKKSYDKILGSLLGGAIGDALGYPVEFISADAIKKKYGPNGITEYSLTRGRALISDDTQMTLFTANGILLADARENAPISINTYRDHIRRCYKDWLTTQSHSFTFAKDLDTCAWLMNIPELFNARAPGITCISALESDKLGSVSKPINSSKGCGGVMRVAPIGLYFTESESMSQRDIDMLGAEAAAITHGHELGYIPAAILVHIISLLSHGYTSVRDAVIHASGEAYKLFADTEHFPKLLKLICSALAYAQSDTDEFEAITSLGEGWVAEEALAISIYCAVKHENDFEKAIVTSVNHNGDSDSTGAITGNILGAHLGADAIPERFKRDLEIYDVICELAKDLSSETDSLGRSKKYMRTV